jgi:hypothetical protein
MPTSTNSSPKDFNGSRRQFSHGDRRGDEIRVAGAGAGAEIVGLGNITLGNDDASPTTTRRQGAALSMNVQISAVVLRKKEIESPIRFAEPKAI